jgi:hypothetical protein
MVSHPNDVFVCGRIPLKQSADVFLACFPAVEPAKRESGQQMEREEKYRTDGGLPGGFNGNNEAVGISRDQFVLELP